MFTVADPREGLVGPQHPAPPPLFLDQTEGANQRAQKNDFILDPPPPPPILSQGLDDQVPPYLKVWIRHWFISFIHDDDMHV